MFLGFFVNYQSPSFPFSPMASTSRQPEVEEITDRLAGLLDQEKIAVEIPEDFIEETHDSKY